MPTRFRACMNIFFRYLLVGVFNTVLHGMVFYLFYAVSGWQALSNFLAFVVAASQSYLLNARYTFNKKTNAYSYMLFTGAMGSVSFLVGWAADHFQTPALLTPIFFSGVSLVLGFLFSKYVVFGDESQ